METETLHRVKEELTRLDSLLNRDVTILRSRIEEADRQYTAARFSSPSTLSYSYP